DLSGEAVINRVDPEINFDWIDGSPDSLLQADSFSVRWTGELEVEFSETYTFYANTDDGVRLWINNELVIDRWVDRRAPTEAKGTIDLIGGQRYPIVMEYYESGGNAVAQLSWENSSTDRQIIPQAALSLPVRASGPNPRNGATGTRTVPTLTWNSGDNAVSHEVYFGTDADAVANATQASPEYKGTKALDDERYDPGKLAWSTSYYWRIDEVNSTNSDSPWIGNVWTFTTGDFLVVDDFETYDSGDNQIWFDWHDGLGFGVPGVDPYFAGNGTGSAVGDETTSSYTEETIVHGGRQSMPLFYDNNKQGYSKYSETELTLTASRDWTEEGVAELSIWFRGNPASVGSFVEGPVGTYTMTGSGTDIWTEADEFHFAYKTLTGVGTIQAQVLSVDNTDPWAKAGIMIRETLDAGSKFAAVYITPGNGCHYQARTETDVAATSDTAVQTAEQTAITAPYWIKLERDFAGNFRCYYSANGTTWQTMSWNPQNIPMSSNIYIGLAVTSHNNNATCQGKFSNVTITGTVSQQWTNQDVGITSNAAEPLYVAIANSAGSPAVVVHDDPAATTIETWTEWVIPLQSFADQGIVLTNVDRIAVGLGTRGNMTIPGGSGKMYFDDIRLYRPRNVAGE
ncbi:MAG TPA: PA14 domain-containing protein, partial [Sedimentisphaerales bacterium]|nr:PA14 domain-containing protein [Sedimentisphaerales bacterium]